MHAIPVLAAGLGAIVLAGCAPVTGPDAAAPRQCFFTSQVNGFQADDERTVFVNVGVSDVYRLELAGPCPDVDWSQSIGIAPRGGGSSVCAGFDAELVVPQASGGTRRCQIRSVAKLSEAEAAARR